MSRIVQINQLVVDHFSVFDVDGFTKISGLIDPADFEVFVWQDAVVRVGFLYTIAEIESTGEYSFTFTPDAVGYWEVEVRCETYSEDWHGIYSVERYSVTTTGELAERSRKHLTNKLVTDPETGVATLYDDDGVTPLETADLFEDVDGAQPYRGQGAERRDGFS